MNARKHGGSRRSGGQTKAYAAPKLVVHGDLKALTRTKKGRNSDGFGKPRTRASGTNK